LRRLLVFVLAMVLLSGCVKQIAHEETRQLSPREKASLQLTEEGRQFLDEDQPDQAIRSLEQAISLNPDNGPCYYYLAEAWLQKGNFSEARQFNSLAESDTPPAERVASGSPPKGGGHVGKAPKGLI